MNSDNDDGKDGAGMVYILYVQLEWVQGRYDKLKLRNYVDDEREIDVVPVAMNEIINNIFFFIFKSLKLFK